MKKQTHKPNLITLSMLISIGAVSGVIFTPAMPDIAHFFGVAFSKVQLSMSFFFLAYALGQLYSGPFCSRFGKKKTINMGLSVAFVGSLLCGISYYFDFSFLVISRFILALGAAMGYALTFLIVSENYSHEQSRKILPKAALGQMVLPFSSTVIGGYISQYLNWPEIFYFLCFYIILLMYLCRKFLKNIEEIARPQEKRHYNFSDYFVVLKFSHLSLFSLIVGIAVAMVFMFGTVAPFLAIHVMGLKNSHFGLMNLFLVGGNFFGMITASSISKYFKDLLVVIFGFGLIIIASFVMIFLFISKTMNPFALFIPTFFVFFANCLVWANAIPLALKGISQKAHASAMVAFINNFCATIGILFISAFDVTNPLLVPYMFLCGTAIQCVLFIFARKSLPQV